MTATELIAAVGAILNIGTPSASTTPTNTSIATWLSMAQDMIVRNVPDDDLQPLWGRIRGTRHLGSDALRVISAQVDGSYYAKWVPHYEYLRLLQTVGNDPEKAIWAYAPATATVDYFWDSGHTWTTIATAYALYGQSFEVTANADLDEIRFFMRREGTCADCTVTAYLYSHSGTYGSTGVPDTLLATSVERDVSQLATTGQWESFVFKHDEVYSMTSAAQYYCVVVDVSGCDVDNKVGIAAMTTDTRDGNAAVDAAGWNAVPAWDFLFYVEGIPSAGTSALSVVIAPEYASDDLYDIVYVRRPGAISTSTRALPTLPDVYDETLILYATALARIQDEEMPDAQYLFQVLGTSVGRSNLPDEALVRRKG